MHMIRLFPAHCRAKRDWITAHFQKNNQDEVVEDASRISETRFSLESDWWVKPLLALYPLVTCRLSYKTDWLLWG